jgi:hypothetical protein
MFIPKIFFWRKYLKGKHKGDQERTERQGRRLTALRLSRPCNNIGQPERGGGGHKLSAAMGKDLEECSNAGDDGIVDGANGGGDVDYDEGIIRKSFEEMLMNEYGVQEIENRRVRLYAPGDECHYSANRPRSDLSSGVRVIGNNSPSFSMNRSDDGSSSNNRLESPNHHLSLSHSSCSDGMVSAKTGINEAPGLDQEHGHGQQQQRSLSTDEEGIEVVVQGCFNSVQPTTEKTESRSMLDENAK